MEPANRQLIHQGPAYTLAYDPQVPCSQITWHGFINSADFRAACMRSFELARAHRLTKSISDARHMRIIALADQQWFLEEYVPMALALKLGPLYSAVIMPADFFGRQSVDNLAAGVEDQQQNSQPNTLITTEYFDNEDAARAWLLRVDAERPRAITNAATPQSLAA